MQIIKDGQIVEDQWVHVAGDAGEEALPEGDIIVPLETWVARRDELLQRNTRLGVRLEPGQEPKLIAEDLDKFTLVALSFPVFKDGRAFSYARLLRDRYGYEGEIRAVGEVARDQMFYMRRCGFNAYEVRPDRDINDALNAFSDFSVAYQGAADDPRPLYRRR